MAKTTNKKGGDTASGANLGFEAKHAELDTQKAERADPGDRDEYRAASMFWVPKEARWQHLKANAPRPNFGTLFDDAMASIERDNPSVKGVLPQDLGRAGLDKQRLGQIINLVSDIALGSAPIARRTRSARCMHISFRVSPARWARVPASSIRPRTSCGCWSRCFRLRPVLRFG